MQEYKDLLLIGLVYLIGTAFLLGAGWLASFITS